jgi:hypothetical protein
MDALPGENKQAVSRLREVIIANLPRGFAETMSYGMISYVVPHGIYPAGYHVNPKEPLPFLSLAAQKSGISLYHMGLYAFPAQLEWFTAEYTRHSKTKLDMGKSCIRFKNPDAIPFGLIGDLCSRITPGEWIAKYETEVKPKAGAWKDA